MFSSWPHWIKIGIICLAVVIGFGGLFLLLQETGVIQSEDMRYIILALPVLPFLVLGQLVIFPLFYLVNVLGLEGTTIDTLLSSTFVEEGVSAIIGAIVVGFGGGYVFQQWI